MLIFPDYARTVPLSGGRRSRGHHINPHPEQLTTRNYSLQPAATGSLVVVVVVARFLFCLVLFVLSSVWFFTGLTHVPRSNIVADSLSGFFSRAHQAPTDSPARF
jgi:hypothetical protein